MKKTLLGIGSFATIMAPIAAIISCDSSNEDYSKIVTIQVETSWIPIYKKIIKNFKQENSEFLKKQGIKDIKIVEAGSMKNKDFLITKGFRDESLADVFIVQNDALSEFFAKNALAEFSDSTLLKFVANQMKKVDNVVPVFEVGPRSQSSKAIKNNKLYGVPENIERMVQYAKSGVTPSTVIFEPNNLWFAAGYFNTSTFNFKDIISQDSKTGIVSSNLEEPNVETAMKKGFEEYTKVLRANVPTPYASEIFDVKNADANVQKYFGTNSGDTGLITGSWSVKKGKIDNVLVSAIATPSNYLQWAGGWTYVINARVSKGEKTIAEKLIGTLLNPKYAAEIYKVANKLSPITQGRTAIANDASLSQDLKKSAEAIYQTKGTNAPTLSAFNSVYSVFKDTVSSKKDTIISSKTLETTANDLFSAFKRALDEKLQDQNSKSS